MAAFGKTTFSHANYASLRPSYPAHLYDKVLGFHKGPHDLLIDLGSGHGLVARYLAKDFKRVIGTDPSAGMIEQAKSATSATEYPNVEFRESYAESLPFVEDHSVDMVVAGQAAHWFDYPRLFAELKRIVRPGGTMAFWGYKDHAFVAYPKATKMLDKFAYGGGKEEVGQYWEMPGRGIVRENLRPIQPPASEWEVERVEYEPGTNGPRSGEGTIFMESRMTLAQNMEYIRTWSSFHGWQEAHPERKRKSAGGNGDCVDELFERIAQEEECWKGEKDWREKMVDVEWGTGLVLARKR